MTDLEQTGGYVPMESFEAGRVTSVAADESRVVVGTETGDVEIASVEGRTTVGFDAPITDLAVGSRVYALADGVVTALSVAGTRVWSVELPAARQLAALPEADVLGAVTDDGRLLGFDGETGSRAFEVDRPYADVTDEPGFFGTDGAFVLVAWSFLAVRNLDGTERFDLNLDGAIESAGIVDETIVVSLKDERVVGVHATTGETQWERELSVSDLPNRGDDALLFGVDGRLVSLSADGTYATVEDLPGGDVYPTSDGTLFCTVTNGTVGVYHASGDPAESLAVSVTDDELVAGETDALDLEIRNAGEHPVSATLRAEGEGVALGETTREVNLEPGESAAQTLPVERVTAEDDAVVAVEADGERLASASLSVADSTGGALVADAVLAAVTDGVATFEVEVRNEGDVPLTGVAISPGDGHVGRLAPGESATAVVEVEVEPGAVVPIAVESDEAATDLDVSIPRDGIEVGVETASDGFVDVRVENDTEARVADDLAVAGNCFDARVERRIDLPEEGTLVVALRPDARAGSVSVEATLDGLGVGQSAQFEADGRRGVSAGRRDRGGSARDETAGMAESETARMADSETAGALLSAERTVETAEPERTRAVRERFVVANEGEATAEAVAVELPSGTVSVGAIRPGEETTVERRHAFTETGEFTLPAAAVTAANASEASVAERTLTVGRGEFAVDVAFEAGDDDHQFCAEVTNDRTVPCKIGRVGVRDIAVWDAERRRVPPGQSVELTQTVESLPDSAATVETAVEYIFADGEEKRWTTLGRVPDDAASRSDGLGTLTATIGEETRVSGGYGSVVLVVENRSQSSVADVTVEARGEDVSDLMYGGRESVDELAPGEQFTHFVDVETDGPDATIPVAVTAGEAAEGELTLRGPAPRDETDWSPETLDAWRVEWGDDDGSASADDHVATEFERA